MRTKAPSNAPKNQNDTPQNAAPRAQAGHNSSLSVAKVLLCISIIAVSTEVITSRSACKEWALEVIKTEQEMEQAGLTALSAEHAYWNSAMWDGKLEHCDFEKDKFCREHAKGKIPALPNIDQEICENPKMHRTLYKMPEWELTCHAKKAMKAQAQFEKVKMHLADKVAQKPLFCSKGRWK